LRPWLVGPEVSQDLEAETQPMVTNGRLATDVGGGRAARGVASGPAKSTGCKEAVHGRDQMDPLDDIVECVAGQPSMGTVNSSGDAGAAPNAARGPNL
jgi:hypothetical protein